MNHNQCYLMGETVNQVIILVCLELTVRYSNNGFEPYRQKYPRGLLWTDPNDMPVGFFYSLSVLLGSCMAKRATLQRSCDSDKLGNQRRCAGRNLLTACDYGKVRHLPDARKQVDCDGLDARLYASSGDYRHTLTGSVTVKAPLYSGDSGLNPDLKSASTMQKSGLKNNSTNILLNILINSK